SAHQEAAYQHLMTDKDLQMMAWVRRFQPFDLYSKSDLPPDRGPLMAYYETLVAEFLPSKLKW
ncbi:MAG: inositol oxygenase, partial [Planctomycetaceae bacterium]